MKRLRYILWALTLSIAHELEPITCASEWPDASKHDKECGCMFHYCELEEGHAGEHRNVVGIRWS